MSKQSDELERLKRLRDRQIGARDPMKKQDKIQRQVSAKAQNREKYTLSDALNDMPAKFTWMVAGGFIGLVVGGTIALVVKVPWTPYLAIGLILFGLIAGAVAGNSVDMGRW